MTAKATLTIPDVAELLTELDVDPLGRPMTLPGRKAIRAGIPDWHPRNEDDDDGDGDGDKGGKGADGDDVDDDDTDGEKGKKGGKDDDDVDDDDDDALTPRERAARRAAAEANRELRALKRDATERQRLADEKAGNFEKLYKDTLDKLEQLEGRVETEAKERLGIAALSELNARNPAKIVKLLDLDEVEDEADAMRQARKLKRSDKDLFRDPPTRQKRGGGSRDEDDDVDDDDADKDDDDKQRDRKAPKLVGAARLRGGKAYGAPKTGRK